MEDNELLLAYRDNITDSTIHQLLSITELKLTQSGEDKKLIKRVFNILVECLQNIVNHGAEPTEHRDNASLLLIGRNNGNLFINTGNKVENSKIHAFVQKVEEVNAFVHDDIREIYSVALGESEYSEKGGAGLGLLDIYKRSGNQLQYEIQPIDENLSFLSVHIKVNSEI